MAFRAISLPTSFAPSILPPLFNFSSTDDELTKVIGAEIAKRAKSKKIKEVVFDRSGYLYHGRVKALAEAARENGLEF